MYFFEFLSIPVSNVLAERERVRLFVMYHSYMILVVKTGANSSELISKRFSVLGDHSL